MADEEEHDGEDGQDGEEAEQYSDAECDELAEILEETEADLEKARELLQLAKQEIMDRINEQLREVCGVDYDDLDAAGAAEALAQDDYTKARGALGDMDPADIDAIEAVFERYDSAYDEFWEHSEEIAHLEAQNAIIDEALETIANAGVSFDEYFPEEWAEVDISDEAEGETEEERWQDQRRLNDEAITQAVAEGLEARDRAAAAEEELVELIGSPNAVELAEDYLKTSAEFDAARERAREISDCINDAPQREGEPGSPSGQKDQLDRGVHPEIRAEQQLVDDLTKDAKDVADKIDVHCTGPAPTT